MKKVLGVVLLVFVYEASALDLQIQIKNIQTNEGNIKLLLFDQNTGFPGDNNLALRQEIVDIVDKTASVTFKSLPEGDYAISMYHDINDNFRLDRRFGIPREPMGFSNNPRLFGTPNYNQCRFSLDQDSKLDIFLKRIL